MGLLRSLLKQTARKDEATDAEVQAYLAARRQNPTAPQYNDVASDEEVRAFYAQQGIPLPPGLEPQPQQTPFPRPPQPQTTPAGAYGAQARWGWMPGRR